MVRDGYTQTRTFLYSGPDLVSATNPENGTVTYTYNGVHQVTTRTDAKGQVTQYAYDSYGRLLSQRYFLPLGGDLVEDTSQAVTYTYDSNPYGGDNVLGRLGVVNFGQSRYDYSYNTAGRVTQQNLQTQISFPDENWNTVSYPTSLTASYGWDNEGRMTSTQSPAGTYNYSFDAMGRLGGMTDGNSNLVASATYGLTGQVSSFWMSNGTTDTRTYNSLMQMTRQTVTGSRWGMEQRNANGHGIPVHGGAEQRADRAVEGLGDGGRAELHVRLLAAGDGGGDDGQRGVGDDVRIRRVREPVGK